MILSGGPALAPKHGTIQRALAAATSGLTFAGQLINTSSSAEAVVLSNTGAADLTISSVTITGTNAKGQRMKNVAVYEKQ